MVIKADKVFRVKHCPFDSTIVCIKPIGESCAGCSHWLNMLTEVNGDTCPKCGGKFKDGQCTQCGIKV